MFYYNFFLVIVKKVMRSAVIMSNVVFIFQFIGFSVFIWHIEHSVDQSG